MRAPTKSDFAMTAIADGAPFLIGEWLAQPALCVLIRGDERIGVEPKVMDLLSFLCTQPGRVFSRAEIDAALWPGVTVGEDTLARAVSKLRRSLGDEAGSPSYIETIPKRGYRVIAVVREPGTCDSPNKPASRYSAYALSLVVLMMSAAFVFWVMRQPLDQPIEAAEKSVAAQTTERANDLYMQFTRADNEAAISLYERALASDPDYAPAQAGLANALVQRVIRWQSPAGDAPSATSLANALETGLNLKGEAPGLVRRAIDLGERARRLSPNDADVLKALGFAYATSGELEKARAMYLRAVELDRDMWEAMINLGELSYIANDPIGAVEWYERAYGVMDRVYESEPQRVGLWRAPLGVLIGDERFRLGDATAAEIWYRRVLDQAPLEPEATIRLARILRARGAVSEADGLCKSLQTRVDKAAECGEAK